MHNRRMWRAPACFSDKNLSCLVALRAGNLSLEHGNGEASSAAYAMLVAGEAGFGPTPSGARGAMLRAYDKATGKEVGGILMPAPQSGSPMTYALNGPQFIVVAVSGGPYSGEYIAYRLPVARAPR